MIEIKVSLDNIDYSGIAELVIPIVKDKLSDNDNVIVKKLFDNLPAEGMSKALNMLLKMLSQDKKDELAVSFFEKYKDNIVKTLKQTANDKGIDLDVIELSVEKK